MAQATSAPPHLSIDRYAALFAREAREQLVVARQVLAATDRPDQHGLTILFRAVHTVKGMAGAMGYAPVERLAHAYEDALGRLRDRGAAIPPSADAVLRSALDALDDVVEASIDPSGIAGPAVDVEPFVTRLDHLRDVIGSADPGATDAASLDASQDVAPAPSPAAIGPTRIGGAVLDRLLDLSGELTDVQERIAAAAARTGDAALARATADLNRLVHAVGEQVREARLVTVDRVFDQLPRIVRQAARTSGKSVEFVATGNTVEADRGVVDALTEPLVHLLRNAIDHGIEPPDVRVAAGKPAAGRVSVRAEREAGALVVHVEDDGGGVDRTAVAARVPGARDAAVAIDDDLLLEYLARPGLSTAARVGALSGRGVGVDAALARVRALGGGLSLWTVAGLGTRFTLRMPVTWTVVPSLLVRAASVVYALPIAHVLGTREAADDDLVAPLGALLVDPDAPKRTAAEVVVLSRGQSSVSLAVGVDELLGTRPCVLRPLDTPRGAFRPTVGATILDGGAVALVLDVPAVVARAAATSPADPRALPCPSLPQL